MPSLFTLVGSLVTNWWLFIVDCGYFVTILRVGLLSLLPGVLFGLGACGLLVKVLVWCRWLGAYDLLLWFVDCDLLVLGCGLDMWFVIAVVYWLVG